MRKKLILPSILALVMFFACKKSNSSSAIVGKWLLTEYYYSIGGPAIHEETDPKHPSIAEFLWDGSLIYYGDTTAARFCHYQLFADSLVTACTNSNSGIPIPSRYELTDDSLKIYPPCIEGCGYTYVRVK